MGIRIMVAVLIDEQPVVRAEGRRRHESVDVAIRQFEEYADMIDRLERSLAATRGTGVANANAVRAADAGGGGR